MALRASRGRMQGAAMKAMQFASVAGQRRHKPAQPVRQADGAAQERHAPVPAGNLDR